MELTEFLTYIAAINSFAFCLFGWDKSLAERGARRVREDTLLLVALLGGWPGAKIAQRRFRHKTVKQPFGSLLNRIPLVWLGFLFILAAAVTLSDLEITQYEHTSPNERTTPRFFTSVGN